MPADKSELLQKLTEGIAQGEYSLLLGAGASIGAIGGNGRPLPTGVGLRDALVEDFEIDTGGEEISLVQAYSYLRSSEPDRLTKYLREWFVDCQPTWQPSLAEFNWSRIWTLNIDDVAEKAFNKQGRTVKPLAWNERFSDRNSLNAQQIIHLHGLASRLEIGKSNEEVLVFSILEYVRAVSSPHTWHKVFLDQFAERPFLIIGAQLTEEIDLAEVLEGGSVAGHSTGFPSVVVVPSITPLRRRQLEAAGLVVEEDDGETFTKKLLDHYRSVRSELDEVYGANTPGIRKFLQQFIDLRKYQPNSPSAEDFYSGYEPTWNTMLNDDDAPLNKTMQALGFASTAATSEDTHQTVVLLTGGPGSGKTTGLLRIARQLIGAGTNPFLFRKDEYVDVDATIEWLQAVPRTVLLFDDCADFSSTIEQLAERCKAQGTRILMIGAERSSRLPLIKDRIDSQFLSKEQTYWYGTLTKDDADNIIDKLHNRGRLGKITRWNRELQRGHFVKSANRRLFDAMSELEEGGGFQDRVRSVYGALSSDRLKNLYAAACLCYEQSIPLPTGIGVQFSGGPSRGLIKLIEEECNGILLLTRNGIRPPHRITASLVVNTLPRSARYEISLSLAKSLAPHVDEQSMRAGTVEYRIIRHLMDRATVLRLVGPEKAREWYDQMREYYHWNGRYWDQRALLESGFGAHETARSYAERSIQVHNHSFGYNTLGTVLLRMAINQGNAESLIDGIKNLERARGFQNWGEREHPFVTFFTSLLRFSENWGINAIPQQARAAWTQWFRYANSATLFSRPEQRVQLEQWNSRWLNLAVGG